MVEVSRPKRAAQAGDSHTLGLIRQQHLRSQVCGRQGGALVNMRALAKAACCTVPNMHMCTTQHSTAQSQWQQRSPAHRHRERQAL